MIVAINQNGRRKIRKPAAKRKQSQLCPQEPDVATEKKTPTTMDALRSAWFGCTVDCKPKVKALPTIIMKNKLITSSAIAALAAAPFLFGCRSVPNEEEGSETAPEGTTALSPEYRRLPASGPVSFTHQVKPILESKCLPCHSASGGVNGFRLDTRTHAFARSAAGARIIPGRPDESLLLALSSAHDGMDVMPRVGNRVTKVEILILRQWILEGALWSECVLEIFLGEPCNPKVRRLQASRVL